LTYSVKEIYYTIQGEGANVGRAAVFLRFTGCNLWSGREEDRATAICSFCDTDFTETDGPLGNKYASASRLADVVRSLWTAPTTHDSLVVCTGGEPLLQLDDDLITALQARGFQVAIETNGTIAAPATIDWICVSPKAGSDLVQRAGNELKLVFPQNNFDPVNFEEMDFTHRFLQPMDGPNLSANTCLAVRYCMKNPRWRLSLQTHKFIGVA